ncbi:hypothetical protein A3J41_00115 [candidate division TM6 bacterium RIFCSPHIGHO2_12_FULL_38_8]|nr:MAG: hypothetical protein A3J41_00115 [candidate division TM6 bacterium RIFCSPHIGHO2_12_FULL_38_8]
MVKFHTKITFIFLNFMALQLHAGSAFLQSAIPTIPAKALTMPERNDQGNIFMHEASKFSKPTDCLPDAVTLMYALKPRNPAHSAIYDFLVKTHLTENIANKPLTKEQIIKEIQCALKNYHPSFNRNNTVKVKEFAAIERLQAIILKRILNSYPHAPESDTASLTSAQEATIRLGALIQNPTT